MTLPPFNKFSAAIHEPSRCVRAPLRSAGEPSSAGGGAEHGAESSRVCGRGHRLSVTGDLSVLEAHRGNFCFDLRVEGLIASISSDQSSHAGALAPQNGEEYCCTNFGGNNKLMVFVA